jgi:hypothetical protein
MPTVRLYAVRQRLQGRLSSLLEDHGNALRIWQDDERVTHAFSGDEHDNGMRPSRSHQGCERCVLQEISQAEQQTGFGENRLEVVS